MIPLEAIYNGLQHHPNGPSFELWTILEPLEHHCLYSTLSRETIESYGYTPINTEVK